MKVCLHFIWYSSIYFFRSFLSLCYLLNAFWRLFISSYNRSIFLFLISISYFFLLFYSSTSSTLHLHFFYIDFSFSSHPFCSVFNRSTTTLTSLISLIRVLFYCVSVLIWVDAFYLIFLMFSSTIYSSP